jgi:hypothetical protein
MKRPRIDIRVNFSRYQTYTVYCEVVKDMYAEEKISNCHQHASQHGYGGYAHTEMVKLVNKLASRLKKPRIFVEFPAFLGMEDKELAYPVSLEDFREVEPAWNLDWLK